MSVRSYLVKETGEVLTAISNSVEQRSADGLFEVVLPKEVVRVLSVTKPDRSWQTKRVRIPD